MYKEIKTLPEKQKDSLIKDTIKNFKRKTIELKIFSSNKLKYKTIWTAEEDRLLLILVQNETTKDWAKISTYFFHKSAIQCSARLRRINPINKKGKWSKEEDVLLLRLISENGRNWSKIAKYLSSRTGKQARDRYVNVLDPNILKDKFDEKEYEIIVEMYKKLGTNWAEISKYLDKRTPDMIKNRFYQYLKPKFNLGIFY
jgi:hypothetical protein